MEGKARRPNHLINEKSPYLLQHAYNPVDWYPWGAKAFEKARRGDKPVFLSIGYSTCHWCHVMEKESYDDPEVGELLNRVFVAVKVDREERPDIDRIYMEVCQRLSGNCGWPLNVLMTPDKKPFYVFTYLPKRSEHGMQGLVEVSENAERLWRTERKELESDAARVVDELDAKVQKREGMALDARVLKEAYELFTQMYDGVNGGFGYAPKFPTPHNLSFLLRYWKRYKDKNALYMVEKTLLRMRLGGLYDQLGLGFHRYSTDPYWLVPHFEKMLYDQAMLAIAYAEAYQATHDGNYLKTLEDILEFVKRDMTSEDGAFYSAIDADSEGEEGKFYVWTYDEVEKALGKEDAELAAKVFGLQKKGNYKEHGRETGKNILHLKTAMEPGDEINKIARKLFDTREKREHPGRDDKILADMNGLMVAAFAKAAQVTGKKEYADSAAQAAKFITEKFSDGDRLYHRYRQGQAAIPGFLDDYAFLIYGLIELYEANFDTGNLKKAIALNEVLLEHFWDEKNFGFYFQADDSEELIAKRKDAYDGAVPSGNSIALLNLLRLGHLTGNLDLQDLALKLESAFSADVLDSPAGFSQFLTALDFRLGPSYEVIIVEGENKDMSATMLKKLNSAFIPDKIVILKTPKTTPMISKIADYTKFLGASGGKTTACVCSNYSCKLPSTNPEQMLEELGA